MERFFIFIFYKNIFSFSKFTGIYPAAPAPLPGDWDLAAPLQGGSGAAETFVQNILQKYLRTDP